MRILVTNDDGVHSPGLWAVVRALRQVGEIMVAAPDRDQSGMGPAMTLLNVVRVQEITPPVSGVTAYSVEGTPGDCVILASESLSPKPFDLVVSGINQGANLGLDVLNSGTVGGAMHGYFRGIPSMAVSVAALSGVDFQPAAQVARTVAEALLDGSVPRPVLLNINVPNVPAHRMKGVEITTLGPKSYLETVQREGDARRSHYWIRHNRPVGAPVAPGSDVWAVRDDRVSITPLDPSMANGRLDGFGVLAEAVASVLGVGRGATGG